MFHCHGVQRLGQLIRERYLDGVEVAVQARARRLPLFGFLGVLTHYVTSGPRRTQPEPPAKDDADANINV